MLTSSRGDAFATDRAMAAGCVRHARMFFNRPDFSIWEPQRLGTFALLPQGEMLARVQADYTAMAGMIFATIAAFDEISKSLTNLETRINGVPQAKGE